MSLMICLDNCIYQDSLLSLYIFYTQLRVYNMQTYNKVHLYQANLCNRTILTYTQIESSLSWLMTFTMFFQMQCQRKTQEILYLVWIMCLTKKYKIWFYKYKILTNASVSSSQINIQIDYMYMQFKTFHNTYQILINFYVCKECLSLYFFFQENLTMKCLHQRSLEECT